MAKEFEGSLTRFDPKSSSSKPDADFQEYVSRELISLSVVPLFNLPLEARAAGVRGEGAKFAYLSGSSQAAVRGQRHRDESPCKFVGFNLLEQGEGLFRQGDKLIRVRAGEGIMYDADPSYTYSFEKGLCQSVILVPHDHLEPSEIPSSPRVFSFDRSGTSGHALRGEIRNVLRNPDRLRVAEHNVAELLPGLMPRGRRSMASYRLQALDLIRAVFADSGLNGETVAMALGISERHLRRAFADEEGGAGRAILRVRLEAAADMLTRAGNIQLSVSEVAARCGFGSLSFFSREFKKQYGASPREYRSQYQFLAA